MNTLQILIQAKDKASAQMGKVSKGIKGMASTMKAAAAGFVAAGAAVTAVIGKMVTDWARAGDEVAKMAKRTGFAAESLSELKYAADISGTSLDAIEKSVKRMAKTITDASEGMATYIRAFERIGLKAEDLIGLAPEKQFDKIAMAIARLEDPTLKAATAQDIFGRSGQELLPLLEEGAEGIKKLREEAHTLGVVFDEEAAVKAEKLSDSLTKLNTSIKGARNEIAEQYAPVLGWLAEKFADLITSERRLDEASEAYHKILERQRRLAIEAGKAHRGEANDFAELAVEQVKAIDNYLQLKYANEAYAESLTIIRARLSPWVEYAEKVAAATEAQTGALKKQEEELEKNAEAYQKLQERIEQATKSLYDLIEAQKEATATRIETMGTLMGQIQAAGGTISPERAEAYYKEMEWLRLSQKYPLSPGPDILVHTTIELDGEKVAEDVSRRLGETYAQREHLGG